jgi:hypothetical protein
VKKSNIAKGINIFSPVSQKEDIIRPEFATLATGCLIYIDLKFSFKTVLTSIGLYKKQKFLYS